MVREYPALVITDVRDLNKNSGNPAFAHPNLIVPCQPSLCHRVYMGWASSYLKHQLLVKTRQLLCYLIHSCDISWGSYKGDFGGYYPLTPILPL